jgi:hypothetical protein
VRTVFGILELSGQRVLRADDRRQQLLLLLFGLLHHSLTAHNTPSTVEK